MEDVTTAISMFGYTVVFGVIGLVLYSMLKDNRRNRRKGDKQYGSYCNSSLVYEIRIDRTTYRYISTWVDWYSYIG